MDTELTDLIERYYPRAEKMEWSGEFYASGACWDASVGFMSLAHKRGIYARWVEFYVDHHPAYDERSIDGGYDVHAVALVTTLTGTYLVDWTTAQYGISEFPLVREWNHKEVAITDGSEQAIDVNGDTPDLSFVAALAAETQLV